MAKKKSSFRYKDSDLKEFKEIILTKLEQVNSEINSLRASISNSFENSDKKWDLEEGSNTWEMESLSEQLNRAVKFRDQLQSALIRIHNKTYGVCRVTGKLIDKARLKAVPHTTLSVEAKIELKK